MPHDEDDEEGGRAQHPVRRGEAAIGGLDTRDERGEGDALDDARERQIGRGERTCEALPYHLRCRALRRPRLSRHGCAGHLSRCILRCSIHRRVPVPWFARRPHWRASAPASYGALRQARELGVRAVFWRNKPDTEVSWQRMDTEVPC